MFFFFLTWLKGKIFSSEHFPFFLLWSYYLNRKRLLLLFDIIEFSFNIFLRLLEPEAIARARKKEIALKEKTESWQRRSFNFLLRYWSAVGMYPTKLRLLHLALLLASASTLDLTLNFPNTFLYIAQDHWSTASPFIRKILNMACWLSVLCCLGSLPSHPWEGHLTWITWHKLDCQNDYRKNTG